VDDRNKPSHDIVESIDRFGLTVESDLAPPAAASGDGKQGSSLHHQSSHGIDSLTSGIGGQELTESPANAW